MSSPAFAASGELLDEAGEVSVADGLGGLDLLHLAVEGGPSHPLGFLDVVSDAGG
jgi:hypothetical protein